MMRWIRWTYVGPRLAAIAFVAVMLHFGLPPLIRWSLTTSGEEAIGAKVEIGEVECSVLDANVILRDVAVADPHKPMRNLLAADLVVLEVEPGSLARKRVVVRRGFVRGLRLGTTRGQSGELEEGERTLFGRFVASAADRGKDWLQGYALHLGEKLDEDLRQEFRSIELVEELATHWPKLYQQYHSRVQDLLVRGRETEAKIREARKNPLRNLAALRDATHEIDQLNRDLRELADEINALQPQLASQRDAVWEAWRADRQKLQERLALDGVDARAISDYLLQEEIAGRVGTIVRWLERVRSIVPSNSELPEPERQRGLDVLFTGMRRAPDYLIRSLELHGTGTAGGQAFELTGTAIGLTTQPSQYGRPTVIRIAGSGAVQLDMEASLDRTGDVPVDRLVVASPAVPRPRVELGRPELFSVALGRGRDEIRADVTVRRSQLEGTLLVTSHTAGLQVSGEDASAARLVDSLNASLAAVRRIETTVRIGGPLREPTLRMESTLGDQVLAAVQSAVHQEVIARRQKMEESLEKQIQARLAEAEHLVEDHRREIEQRLSEQQTTLIRLAADTFGMGDRPTIRLGSADAGGDRPPSSRASAFQR